MMMSSKMLADENAAQISDVAVAWEAKKNAPRVLAQLNGYWPVEDIETEFRTCQVCRLPVESGDTCSSVCRRVRGMFQLKFATYSTARVLEPIIRSFKDGTNATKWIADFLNDLTMHTFGNDVDRRQTTFVMVPHRATRNWSPNAAIWAGVMKDRPSVSVFNRIEDRVPRATIDPSAYDVSEVPLGASITLLDDLWTTGATLGSLATACASRQINLNVWTVGRQLRPDTPTSVALYKRLRSRHG